MAGNCDEDIPGEGLAGLSGRVTAVQVLSVIKIVMGTICFAFGIPTIILSSANPAYPFSSGSGIYTGILVIVAGILALLMLKEAEYSNPTKLKGYYIAYRVFLTIGLDVGVVHFAYGIWSMVVCSQGVGQMTCGGVNWSANYLLAAVNMTIGLTILVVSIVTFIVAWKLFKVLWKMSKVQSFELTEKL